MQKAWVIFPNIPCLGLDNPKGKHPVTEFWTFEEFKKGNENF